MTAKNLSFQEYISKRFDNKIFNSLASHVEEAKRSDFDRLDLRLRRIRRVGDVELYDTKVLRVDAYDLPGSEVGFDIRVEAHIKVCEGDHHYDNVEFPQQWFVLRCTGDLEKDLADFSVNGIDIYNSKDKYKRKLYDSLVPVIYRDDYEQAAMDFLKRNYPKGLVQPGYIDPIEVAKGMGLHVIQRAITKDCSVFGQVYFRDCDTELYNDDTDEMETVHVPARTILVDPQTYFLYNLGKVSNTIIHECVHWDFHRKAFELDRLCNNDVSMIGCRVVGGVKGRDSHAVSIMERQANSLTPRIQMPMGAFKTQAIKWIRYYREKTGKTDLIDIIQPVIDALAIEFHVSRLAAKIRMVDAGYEEAIGAFNWIEDHYVATHRFKKGSLKPNQTFTIGAEDLFRELVSNPRLKELISDGSYIYVDSHLVLASGKYIRTDEEGMTVLTDYARNHMDECCLAFDMTVEGCDDNEYYTVCYLNKDKDAKITLCVAYNDGLQNSSPERQKEALDEFVLRYAEIFTELGTDYVKCLQMVFEKSGMTYKELAENTGLNVDVVSRIINGKHAPTTESLALICFGLKLPYNIVHHIFEHAPCSIYYRNPDHVWIDFALMSMTGKSMASIKQFLGRHKVFL